MKKTTKQLFARTAVLAIAEVKAAVMAFDRGDTNVFEALDAVVAAVAARRGSVPMHRRPARPRRRAA